ncbi:MAG: DUF3659 domain-containing protein [Lachnospiraceae bacterium]|nr:DUF3659 domain-containing protein [Lachnospiraceae bacterium]
MIRKRMIGQLIILSLMMGVSGCGRTQDNRTEEKAVTAVSEERAGTEEQTGTEERAGTVEKADSDNVTGQGFQPPKGSRVDKNGNIVDREGNTYDREGKWQVPEGGWVDSQGRIHDKNGKLMGGGATIGSQG